MIEAEEAENFKDQMKISAFTVWQSGDTGKKGFNEYLRSLGLTEEAKLTEEQKAKISEHAIAKAERIRKADKKCR